MSDLNSWMGDMNKNEKAPAVGDKDGTYGGLFGLKTKTKTKEDRRRSNVGVVTGDIGSVSSSDDGPAMVKVKASEFCDSDDEEFKLDAGDGDGDADLDLGTTY